MSQKCSICTHPDREAIDQAILFGIPNRRIAAQYGVSESAVRRHKAGGHIPRSLTKATEAQERLNADKLLGVMERLLNECLDSVSNARQAQDEALKLRAIREGRETARVLLEVAGEIQQQASAEVNISFASDPGWQIVQNIILDALAPYPEARDALVSALNNTRIQ